MSATFVVLVAVLQMSMNSTVRRFHSSAPSDGNAHVFVENKAEILETGIERSREKRSLESDKDASQGQKGVNADTSSSESHAKMKLEEDSRETRMGMDERVESDGDQEKEDIPSKSLGKNNKVSINHVEGIADNLHTGERVKDVGYLRTKCFSSSGQPQNHTCAPAVLIAGYEKCGTSALYYKLTKHPEIVAHATWKENCPTDDSLEAMWSWFENRGTPVLNEDTENGVLLNGCIGIVSKPLILRELQRMNPNLKVLAAFRNYADWAYSFYGYRCYPGYDHGCEKLKGPTSHGPWKEKRNPNKFAKLVAETSEAGKSPYEVFGVIEPNVNLFRQWLEELVDIVGRDAVKIVKQEDLAFSSRETLESVARFLEIDPSRFDDEAYSLVSNMNDHPAQISSVEANRTKDEISTVINSGSVIHEDTRVQLNKFWKPECEWLRDNFDVRFSEVC